MNQNKKRILYADLLAPRGHIQFNNIYLTALHSVYDIIFVSQGSYVSEINLPSSCIRTYSYPTYASKMKGRIASIGFRFHQIMMQKYCIDIAIKEDCDAIIFSSFENIALYFSHFKKIKIIAICHNNAEQIIHSRLKQALMRSLSERINLVTLTRGAFDFFSSIGINNHLLPHGYIESPTPKKDNKQMFFIPINESQDTQVIEYLLSDDYCSLLSEHDCTLIIKQKIANLIRHKSKQIKIIENHLSNLEYEYYFNNSTTILLPYRCDYSLRSSGIAMEAIAKNKFIISPNTISFSTLKKDGDIGVLTYSTLHDIKQLSLFTLENHAQVSYNNIKQENSSNAITMQIKTILS